MKKACEKVYADPSVVDYLLDIVEATRKHNNIALGVRTRLVSPDTLLNEDPDNFWLCCFFYGAAICLCFVGEYIRGRYLLLYCNPSVSRETRKRFRVNMRKYLIQMAMVGVVTLVFFLIFAQYKPEVKMPGRQRTSTVQREKEEKDHPAVSRKEDKRSQVRKEQVEQSSNLFLVILRYVVTVAILAVALVAVAYGLFRLFLFLLRGRRRAVDVFEETTVEKNVEGGHKCETKNTAYCL